MHCLYFSPKLGEANGSIESDSSFVRNINLEIHAARTCAESMPQRPVYNIPAQPPATETRRRENTPHYHFVMGRCELPYPAYAGCCNQFIGNKSTEDSVWGRR